MERSRAKDVDPHGYLPGWWNRRLLEETADPAGFIRVDHPEPPGLLQWDLGDRHRRVRSAGQVRFDHGPIVHPVHVVAGEDEDVLGLALLDADPILVDRVGRPAVPVGFRPPSERLQKLHPTPFPVEVPRPADADVIPETQRAILREDSDIEDSRIHAVGEREVDDAIFATERNGRLRALFREEAEPASQAAGKDHRVGNKAQGTPPDNPRTAG